MIAKVLNFTIRPFQVEVLPLAIMGVLSLGVPLLAGLVPVRNGAVTTIRAAISGYGLNAAYGRGLIDRFFTHLHWLSRPLLISLRNTVRRKARLTLTVATLVLAEAIFMGMLGAQASMSAGLTKMYHYYLADVNVDFDRVYRVNNIATLLGDLPGVQRVEGWIFASGEVRPDGALPGTSQVATDRLTLMAPPADSGLVERSVLSGRWLLPDDQNALVLCTPAMRAHPEWHVGSVVHLKLNSKVEADFTIVGTFPFASGEGNKIGMASYAYLADLLNERGQASSFRIVTSPHDNATQDRVRDAAVEQFKALGYSHGYQPAHQRRFAGHDLERYRRILAGAGNADRGGRRAGPGGHDEHERDGAHARARRNALDWRLERRSYATGDRRRRADRSAELDRWGAAGSAGGHAAGRRAGPGLVRHALRLRAGLEQPADLAGHCRRPVDPCQHCAGHERVTADRARGTRLRIKVEDL
jgi:hypothetical protein